MVSKYEKEVVMSEIGMDYNQPAEAKNKGAWQADGKPTIALDGFLN